MQNAVFMVNDKPYCIWDIDLKERNSKFLESIDPEYFEYSLETHMATTDKKRAAISLRSTLHHAMETFFSLLGAFLQAPDCAYAWISKCENSDLRKLLDRINSSDDSVFRKLNMESLSWNGIARCVYRAYKPGTERQQKAIDLFAKLWENLSIEFLDPNHRDEYNAIKHGFRLQSGGFAFSFAPEDGTGKPPSDDKFTLLGSSDTGSSFLRVKRSDSSRKNRSLIAERVHLNWSLDKVNLLIQAISVSILNLTSAMKIANGFNAKECRFASFVDDADFEAPWKHTVGVTSLTMPNTYDKDKVISISEEELMQTIKSFLKTQTATKD